MARPHRGLARARAQAAGSGTRVLVAARHVSRHYPNDLETIVQLTGELNAGLAAEDINITVDPGRSSQSRAWPTSLGQIPAASASAGVAGC
jgi:hypothetical protein